MAQYSAINQSGQNSPFQHPNESTGFIAPASAQKKRTSPWIKFGLPVAILVIVGAVLGGVLGSRAAKNGGKLSSSSNSNSGSGSSSSSGDGPGGNVAGGAAVGLFATATNSEFMVPVYPSATNTAAFGTPTFAASATNTWPAETFSPANPAPTSLRPDRPYLIAPAWKWKALPNLIANDPYMKSWNDTIFGNATDWFNADPVPYFMDGSSGILDVARQTKERIKAFGYAYRLTNDTKWANRMYKELQVCCLLSFHVSIPLLNQTSH
jgi:hypothetical protein